MATKSPSHPSRQRRVPASSGRSAAAGETKSARRRSANTGASRKGTAGKRRPAQDAQRKSAQPRALGGRLSLLKPPPPEQVVAAVREKLERLGQRWKNLLPRLKRSGGSNGSGKRAKSKRGSRA